MRVLFFLLPAALLIGLSSFQFIGPNVAAYSVIWLLGVVANERERPLMPLGALPMAGVLVAYLLLVRVLVPTEWADNTFGVWFVCDTGLAVVFANFILCLKAAKPLPAPPGRTAHTRLAAFAFSLYCTHLPLLNLFAAVTMFEFGIGWQMVPVGLTPWFIVFGGIVTAIAFAYGFSLLTEANTDRVRRFIERRIDAIYPAFRLSETRSVRAR